MGRPSKPIEIHKRDGTYQPCRHAGPELKKQAPIMPSGLEGIAVETWERVSPIIAKMGVLTEADWMSLQLLCESYGEYVQACETIKTEGRYISQVNKNGSEYQTEHPAVKSRSRCWKEVIELCRQFGMTPASRTGLHVGKPEEGGMSALDRILAGARN
jgi:P27 family predicted phage terminase small subunit